MILKLLLNIWIIWIIFTKTLKNTTQTINVKILIVFDDMIAYILSNEKLNSIVTELFTRGRKLNISLVFIEKTYFKVPKHVGLSTMYFLFWKLQTIENLNKLHIIIHQILTLQAWWNFTKIVLYQIIDDTLASDNPLHFRKNIKTNHDNWW